MAISEVDFLRDIENRIPGYIFRTPGEFISYGFNQADDSVFDHSYDDFDSGDGLPAGKANGDPRGVAKLNVFTTTGEKKNVIYLVYLYPDEIGKNFQVYAKKDTWKLWGGIEVEIEFDGWGGYLVVIGRITGDPPIAVG